MLEEKADRGEEGGEEVVVVTMAGEGEGDGGEEGGGQEVVEKCRGQLQVVQTIKSVPLLPVCVSIHNSATQLQIFFLVIHFIAGRPTQGVRLIQTTIYSSAYPAWRKYLPNEGLYVCVIKNWQLHMLC